MDPVAVVENVQSSVESNIALLPSKLPEESVMLMAASAGALTSLQSPTTFTFIVTLQGVGVGDVVGVGVGDVVEVGVGDVVEVGVGDVVEVGVGVLVGVGVGVLVGVGVGVGVLVGVEDGVGDKVGVGTGVTPGQSMVSSNTMLFVQFWFVFVKLTEKGVDPSITTLVKLKITFLVLDTTKLNVPKAN